MVTISAKHPTVVDYYHRKNIHTKIFDVIYPNKHTIHVLYKKLLTLSTISYIMLLVTILSNILYYMNI